MRWKDIKKCITSLTQSDITEINDTSNSISKQIDNNKCTYKSTCVFEFSPSYVDEGQEAWECSHCENIWITYDEWRYCPECGYEILSYNTGCG